MITRYSSRASLLRFAPAHRQAAVIGTTALVLAVALLLLSVVYGGNGVLSGFYVSLARFGWLCSFAGVLLLLSARSMARHITDTDLIVSQVRQGLFCPVYGNPLHLRDGELLPPVSCKKLRRGCYDLTIGTHPGVTTETIADITSALSSALSGRFASHAVTQMDVDVACGQVTLRLEDVTTDRALVYHSLDDLRPKDAVTLQVDAANHIDLTTSGSILVAGKTRSGKTTGVIALLLQVLLAGPDDYGSQVLIIDPKQAELSRLPHTVTLDDNGEAGPIWDALKEFALSITRRQRVLNDLSEQTGDAVKWWDAGMHPSFLFIDEYVSLRTILPAKKSTSKGNDYSLDDFDRLIKRIVTMGASAGCYVIISIAEASVQEGGLPAMLRSAMSTRILFNPTRAEALLIWDKAKLETMPDRVYVPGDAWYSSTDGVHDAVTYVRFPRMTFPVYGELGRLLQDYWQG